MSRKTAVTRRRFFQSAGAGAAGCAVAAALPVSLQAQDAPAQKTPEVAGGSAKAGSQAKKLKSHKYEQLLPEQMEKEQGGRVGAMKFWGGGVLDLVRDWLQGEAKREPLAMGHGMMWETSLMMAIHPDWIDLPRAQRIKDGPLLSQLSKQPQPAIDYIAKANAEYGNRAITLAAQKAAELARGLLS